MGDLPFDAKRTELQPKNLVLTMKHNGVLVVAWGCSSVKGVDKLHFIEGTMNQIY